MENRKIIAVDGNSLIFRAFYALPPLSTKSGIYTNAVYGFVNMLNKVFEEYDPAYMAVAFDLKGPTFRHLEYAEYKAGRKKTPFELLQQFPLLKKVLNAMDIKVLELETFEADDIIGTVVKRAESEGLEPYVITGDKDALQLASDTTKIIITRKGLSEFDVYDKEAMQERYHMTPEQFIDLKGLMGDSSDNIPGIPGVGEKTGIALIEQFGSVENLVNNIDQIKKPKLREKVEEHAALAVMSRRLAEINTNVPIDFTFDELKVSNPDRDKLVELYREMELISLATKIDKTWIGKRSGGAVKGDATDDAAESESVSTGKINYPELSWDEKICDSIDDIKASVSKGESVFIKIFGDTGHVKEPQIYGAAFGIGDKYFYAKDIDIIRKAFELFADNDITFKGHMLKNDYYMLKSILDDDYVFNTAYDSAIGQYVLDPQRNDFDYSAISTIYLGEEMESESAFYKSNAKVDLFGESDRKFAEYGMKCLSLVRNIEASMTEQIEALGLGTVYNEIELPLIEIFADMEFRGFKTDKSELSAIGDEIDAAVGGMKERIYELAGEEFNINSPKQLGVILFEKLGIPGGKKTKTGYSTSVDVLEKLTEEYEIADQVLKYRTLAKLKSTYIDGLIPLISDKDGKIRAHFQQTGTATGRISCTEPNLQNIPVRQELGRTLRKAFVPEEGCILVGADYSQIELRVLAHISKDENMIEAFLGGADIHRSTAARVFEVPEDEVTSIQRSNAKAVNFGVIYGMSSFGLSGNLNITRKEAERYIKEYFAKYSAVKKYMDETVAQCRENGYVTTIKGRRRDIPAIKVSNFMQRQAAERLAMNSPIQGSAADIIKLAMIKVFRELREKNYRSKMILQVHDELIINTHEDELEAVKELLQRNMMGAAELAVPLEVSMNSGMSWYDVK